MYYLCIIEKRLYNIPYLVVESSSPQSCSIHAMGAADDVFYIPYSVPHD